MSEPVGYQLVVIATGEVLQQWGGEFDVTVPLPNPIRLANGDMVCGATIGWRDETGTIELRAWMMDRPADVPAAPDPIDKLKQFLDSNPDVKALLGA